MLKIYIWFVLSLFLATKGANRCLYQYIQQPEDQLDCNPFGSRLQLHCGATGPFLPPFNIQWYSSRSKSCKNATKLTKNEYPIRTSLQDVMEEERSATSVLLTQVIDSTQSGLCFWCQIELSGLTLPTKSDTFCINSEQSYSTLNVCPRQSIMRVKTSVQCANISSELVRSLKRLINQTEIKASPTFSTSTAQSATSRKGNTGLVVTVIGSEAIKLPSTSININLHSLHIGTQSATSSSKTKVDATPSSRLTEPFVRSSSVNRTIQERMNNTSAFITPGTQSGGEETVPRSSFEGALYAAIVVCILFVGVIVVLAIVILCLSRKKCSCVERAVLLVRQKFQSGNNSRISTQQANDVSATNLVSEHIDGRSLEESYAKSTQIEGNYSQQKKAVTTQNSNSSGHSKRSTIERESHQITLINQPPPELPPKPKRLVTTPSGYDHLEPVTLRVEKSAKSTERTTSMQLTLSASETYDGKPPVKDPHHFYHTLENDGSGLLRSATVSRASSQAFTIEEEDNKGSIHLQELFDDPRYARLKLDPYGNEKFVTCGLTKQKDFSRSSPSIVTLIQPQETLMQRGATERRSLRLPKWISTTKTRPDIYEN